MNLFIEKIKKHKISSKEEAQRLFWKLSLKIHPDKNKERNAKELFIKLKADYEEAIVFLNKNNESITEKKFNRLTFLSIFGDLIASNYPIDRKVLGANKLYLSRIQELRDQFNYRYSEIVDYDEFENELYQIRGDEIIMNRELEMIRDIFYKLINYHYGKFEYVRKGINHAYPLLFDALEKRKAYKVLKFIQIMMDEVFK